MTIRELDAALKELGWRGADLARKLDVHPNAVSKWRTGKSPVPGYAAAYLKLALAVKRLAGEVL